MDIMPFSVEYNSTMQRLINLLTQRSRNLQSALDIIKIVMEEVEKTSATGQEKMQMLETIITSSEFRRIPLPNALWQSIDIMMENNLLKPTVEMIVLASSGKLDINKSVTCCLTFLQKYFQKRTQTAAPSSTLESPSNAV